MVLLMNLKMLERFLMGVKAIFYLKKQIKLEKKLYKRSCPQSFKKKTARR